MPSQQNKPLSTDDLLNFLTRLTSDESEHIPGIAFEKSVSVVFGKGTTTVECLLLHVTVNTDGQLTLICGPHQS